MLDPIIGQIVLGLLIGGMGYWLKRYIDQQEKKFDKLDVKLDKVTEETGEIKSNYLKRFENVVSVIHAVEKNLIEKIVKRNNE